MKESATMAGNVRGSLNLELALIVSLLVIACVGALTFLGLGIAGQLDSGSQQAENAGVVEEAAYAGYFLSDGAGTITSYNPAGSGVNETIPASINGVATTKIANSAAGNLPGFNQLSGTLTFPDSITSIGNYAFYYCSGLSGTLTLPTDLVSIGSSAFESCSNLSAVSFPAGLTSIGGFAFMNCSDLTGTLTLPAGLTNIGGQAFQNCSGLTGTLTIPASITSIGAGTFVSCSGFTALNLPAGLQSIESQAFSGCSSLTDITVPSAVGSIEAAAFYNCSGLTVRIPEAHAAQWTAGYLGCGTVVTYPPAGNQ